MAQRWESLETPLIMVRMTGGGLEGAAGRP